MLSVTNNKSHRNTRKALPQAPEAACQAELRADQEGPGVPEGTPRRAYGDGHPSGAVPPPYVSNTCLLHSAWKYKSTAHIYPSVKLCKVLLNVFGTDC